MKRTAFNVIMSILLILASLLAIGGAAWGVLEAYALNEMKDKLDDTKKPISQLEEAINTLKDTEEEYLGGITACYDGDVKIVQGNGIIEESKAKLKDSEAQLADAQAQYDEAKAQLDEGKAQLAEAKAQMEASKPDYEAGKAQLEKLESLQPLLHRYLELRANVLEGNAAFEALDALFDGVIVPTCARLGLSLPTDPYAFSEYMDQQIADGKAKLAEYEKAEAQLADAQAQIDEAEAQLGEAKSKLDEGYSAIDRGYSEISKAQGQLSDAAAKIAEGKASLSEYEDAIGTVEEAILTLMETAAINKRDGSVAIEGMAARLGDGFDIYKRNEEGKVLSLHNGEPRIDYDKCLEVCSAYSNYIDDYQNSLAAEGRNRVIIAGVLLLEALFGIVAAIFALRGKAASAKMGLILFVSLIVLNVLGMFMGYMSYTHPEDKATYQGTITLLTIWLLTLVSLLFMIAVRKGRKKMLAIEAEAATVMPEPVAAPVGEIEPALSEKVKSRLKTLTKEEAKTENKATAPKKSIADENTESLRADYEKAHEEYEKALQEFRNLLNK